MSPSWHRLSRHAWLLAALAVGLVAAWLTVARGLPTGSDSAYHIYRLVERDALIREGILFSRWSPWLGYGYGFPLYNYYGPLLSYLAEPLVLLGLGPLVALQAVLVLALLAGALGMARWVGELFGPGPGVVAATAYLFCPYYMYTLVNRAGFPEIVVLGLAPWSLWALRKLAMEERQAYGFACALIVALALLTHLFSAYLLVASLLAYGVTLGLTTPGPARARLRGALQLVGPVALGAGLSALFWLPAMVETNLIRIEDVLTLGDPTGGRGLMSLQRVFDMAILPDVSARSVRVGQRLSGLAAGLGLAGLVVGWLAAQDRMVRVHLTLGAVIATTAVFMLTPLSSFLWEGVPLLKLAQFPFRFLALASLWLTLLAGAGTWALLALLMPEGVRAAKEGWVWRDWAGVGLVLVLTLGLSFYALQWPELKVHSADMPVGLESAMGYEQSSPGMGLLAAGEYLPKTVLQQPVAGSGPASGDPRLAAESLPEGAEVLQFQYRPLRYRVEVDSPEPFVAVFLSFHFPGWRATVGDRTVPITPTEPYGLISLAVPAGRQTIQVRFGSTPVRTLATGLSLVSGLVLVGWVIRSRRAS